jgi:hypothetical protein
MSRTADILPQPREGPLTDRIAATVGRGPGAVRGKDGGDRAGPV